MQKYRKNKAVQKEIHKEKAIKKKKFTNIYKMQGKKRNAERNSEKKKRRTYLLLEEISRKKC